MRNTIFSAIYNAVSTYSAFVTSTYAEVSKTLPTVYAHQVGLSQEQGAVTLTHDDVQHRITYEVQIFSQTQANAWEIQASVESAMKNLYFVMDTCEPIENIDPSIYRIVMRFHRVVGASL